MDMGVLGMLQSPCWSLEVQQKNFRGTFSSLKILKGRVRTKSQGVSYQLVSCCFGKTEISRGGREAAANLYLPHTPLSHFCGPPVQPLHASTIASLSSPL